MKYLSLLLITLSFALSTKAQTLTEEEIVGTWTVVKATVLARDYTKDELAKLEPMRRAFLKSKLTFRDNKHCSIECPIKDLAIKDGHWKFDKESNKVVLQSWKDKDTDGGKLMVFSTDQEAGEKILFVIDETPLMLEVKRKQ